MDAKFVAASALAVIVTLVAIFSLRPLAPKLGLVDRPDERKRHRGRVPLIGGVCFFLGTTVGLMYFGYLDRFVVSLLAVSGLIVLTGLIDDMEDLSVRSRLCIQASAAGLVIASTGIYVDGLGRLFGEDELRLHLLGIPITIVAVVGLINAFNMLDGIDGLAGSMAMVSIVSILAFSGAGWPTLGVALLLQILSIALIPYLCVNLGWPDGRKIFMGDAGSTLIGFLLAWGLIFMSHRNVARLAPVDVLWCIALPILDILGVMYRRASKGLSPFKPDRQHLHHLLLDAGYSSRETLVLIVGAGGILASVGYALRDVPDLLNLLVFAAVSAAYVLWLPKPLRWLHRTRFSSPRAREPDISLEPGLALEAGSNASLSGLVPEMYDPAGALSRRVHDTLAPDTYEHYPNETETANHSRPPVKALCVIGASPDDVRMAPIVQLLSHDDRFDAKLCITAPPDDGTVRALNLLGIRSDVDPNIARHDQSPIDIASATLGGMTRVMNEFRPDVVLIHGDTPTSLATALAAYYQKIPLARIETAAPNDHADWPDGANRKIINALASLHFISSEGTGKDLVAAGVPAETVTVAGNAAVDTLRATVAGIHDDIDLKMELGRRHPYLRPRSPLLFVSGRSRLDDSFSAVGRALRKLAKDRPDVDIVVCPSGVGSEEWSGAVPSNIHRPASLDYLSLAYLLDAAYLIVASPGELDREAAVLNKPVVIVDSGAELALADSSDTVRCIASDEREVVDCVMNLLDDSDSYDALSAGDGSAQDDDGYSCIAEALASLPRKTSSLAA